MTPSRKWGRKTAELSALAFVAAALWPAASQATITVGSDLSLPATGTSDNCGLATAPCTDLLIAAHAGNQFPAKSPTSGVVVAFGIKTGVLSGGNDTVTFRLGRISDDFTKFAGDGTGPTVALHEPGIYSFPGPGPAVKAGDFVGIDATSTRAISAFPGSCPPGSASYDAFHPVLTDGTFQPASATSICEVLVNMVIQPTSVFSFGNLKYKNGKAYLIVKVPGPGELSLSGKGVAKQGGSRRATASKTVGAAGTAKLQIKPTGSTKTRLAQTGRATVKVKVTFAPVGGTRHTEKHTVKLKK
jgi:hypothetical protein